MNAAERLEAEEQARERTRQQRKAELSEAAAIHRRAHPELVYKTTDDARASPQSVVVSPKTATPEDAQMWWEWVDARIAASRSEIKRDYDLQFRIMHDAVAEALGTKVRDITDQFKREIKSLKSDLEQAKIQLDAQAELAREREALRARIVEADRTERESLRRELAMLREHIGVERGLQTMQAAVAQAQSEIPKVPEMVDQLTAEQVKLEARQRDLKRELAATKDKLGKLRVDHALTNNRLANFIDEQAAAPHEAIEIETTHSRFAMRGISPAAARALREFANHTLNHDGSPLLISPLAGNA